MTLDATVREHVYFQKYDPQTSIAGVSRLPIRKHRAENGWFAELFRVEGGHVEGTRDRFEIRQLSVSHSQPGRINAFHIHPLREQNEIWAVLQGSMTVWLVDCREGSGTLGAKQKVILTAEEPDRLIIPAGVAHGFRAGPEGAMLLYAMDDQFDPASPNEGRLPWDYFGSHLWDEDRG